MASLTGDSEGQGSLESMGLQRVELNLILTLYNLYDSLKMLLLENKIQITDPFTLTV